MRGPRRATPFRVLKKSRPALQRDATTTVSSSDSSTPHRLAAATMWRAASYFAWALSKSFWLKRAAAFLVCRTVNRQVLAALAVDVGKAAFGQRVACFGVESGHGFFSSRAERRRTADHQRTARIRPRPVRRG